MGDEAERAEDGWWALSASERARIEREIEQEDADHLAETPWRRDDREREERAERWVAPFWADVQGGDDPDEREPIVLPFEEGQRFDSESYRRFRDRYVNINIDWSKIVKDPKDMTRPELLELMGQFLAGSAQVEEAPSRWPAQPPVASVIRFTKVYRGTRRGQIEPTPPEGYTYVAVRTGAQVNPWFITGRLGRESMDWPKLCAMIGDTAKVEIATAWVEIPALPEADAEPEMDAAEWVAKFLPGSPSQGDVQAAG